MVDLQKVNNKIEELFKSIETMSNPLTQRDHAEMSSVENSLNAAEDFIRFEQKKHNHDDVSTILFFQKYIFLVGSSSADCTFGFDPARDFKIRNPFEILT